MEFYSACCLMNLRCLRVFLGKCVGQQGTGVVSISTKTRVGLLAILSNFNSSATSASFRALKVSMGNFQGDVMSVEEEQDQFHVVSLCNESLYLWGVAIPLTHLDNIGRVEFWGVCSHLCHLKRRQQQMIPEE